MSKIGVCNLCNRDIIKTDYSSYTIETCSDFCTFASAKEKEDFKKLKPGTWGTWPCFECGIAIEGEYSVGGICSICSEKQRFLALKIKKILEKENNTFLQKIDDYDDDYDDDYEIFTARIRELEKIIAKYNSSKEIVKLEEENKALIKELECSYKHNENINKFWKFKLERLELSNNHKAKAATIDNGHKPWVHHLSNERDSK